MYVWGSAKQSTWWKALPAVVESGRGSCAPQQPEMCGPGHSCCCWHESRWPGRAACCVCAAAGMLRPTDWALRRAELPEVLPWRTVQAGCLAPPPKQQISACMTGGRALQQFCSSVWKSSAPGRLSEDLPRALATSLGFVLRTGGVLGGSTGASSACAAPHGLRSVGLCVSSIHVTSLRGHVFKHSSSALL